MVIQRYMTENKDERIVAHVFECAGDDEPANETEGTASLVTRDDPGDMWGPPVTLGQNIPYLAWRLKVELDGFTHA